MQPVNAKDHETLAIAVWAISNVSNLYLYAARLSPVSRGYNLLRQNDNDNDILHDFKSNENWYPLVSVSN